MFLATVAAFLSRLLREVEAERRTSLKYLCETRRGEGVCVTIARAFKGARRVRAHCSSEVTRRRQLSTGKATPCPTLWRNCMKILGMGVPELLIILVVILLIFGPKNLPKLGSALGKTVKNLREGMGAGEKDVEEAADDEEVVEVVEEVVEEPAAAPKKTVKKVVKKKA